MRLKEIVVFNICAVASLRWIAPAAQAGSASLVFFALAACLFFLPSGIVVSRLARQFPEEGGLYIWTKRSFGTRHAFLCSWFYFISNVFYFPSLVLFAVSTLGYLFGLEGAALAGERRYAIPAALFVLWALFLVNYLGLGVANWVESLGAAAIILTAVLLGAFALAALAHGHSATEFHGVPALGWEQLNQFAVIAFALVGLELAPILSGEMRQPRRDIPRAALIAGVVCVLFYVLGTGALLVLVEARAVSPITGLVEAGSAAGALFHIPGLRSCFALLIALAAGGQLVTWIAGNTRLPYVIGLARFLPPSFAQLHPRWKTPYVSLLAQVAVATVFLVMAQSGETVKVAYQIMLDMLVIATFIPFVYIFAAGWLHASRAASFCGAAVTIIAIALSMKPPAGVSSAALFEFKVLGGFIAVSLAGLLIYRRYAPTGEQ